MRTDWGGGDGDGNGEIQDMGNGWVQRMGGHTPLATRDGMANGDVRHGQ
jgi:hypothetical protein